MYVNSRKFARARAKQLMEKEGVKHKNKKLTKVYRNPITGAEIVEKFGSYFSNNWRKEEYGNYLLKKEK